MIDLMRIPSKRSPQVNSVSENQIGLVKRVQIFSVQNILEILAILVFLKDFVNLEHVLLCDQPLSKQSPQGMRSCGADAAPWFLRSGCLYKAFVCTGIQPCEALAQKLNVQLSLLKVDTVQVCNLKLASCAWLQIFCVLYNLVVVEVETGDIVVAFGLFRFLFNGNSFSVLVEFHDAETLRIIYIVSENSGTFACFCCCLQQLSGAF